MVGGRWFDSVYDTVYNRHILIASALCACVCSCWYLVVAIVAAADS